MRLWTLSIFDTRTSDKRVRTHIYEGRDLNAIWVVHRYTWISVPNPLFISPPLYFHPLPFF